MDKVQASDLYPLFNPDDKQIIDSMVGIVNQIIFSDNDMLTNFLTPREIYILNEVITSRTSLFIESSGGYVNAEKKRALITHEYEYHSFDDFKITPLQLKYGDKFNTLEHRQIYGALNNLGITQESFGDIIHHEGVWQLFVKSELKDFFIDEFRRAGSVNIKLVEINQKQIIQPDDDSVEQNLILISKRLDVFIATAFNISRNKAQELIESKQVKQNFGVTTKTDTVVSRNDLISVRGFGRIKFDNELAQTKNGKYRLSVSVWKRKGM